MKKFIIAIKVAGLSIVILSNMFAQQRYKSEANADVITYTVKEGLPVSKIASVSQTTDGYIWISGLEGTVRFNGYEFQEPGKEYGLPDMQFNYYDSVSNTMYFASPDKFIILKDNKFKLFTKKDGYQTSGLPGRNVSFIKKDSKKRIWIGTSTIYIDDAYNGSLTLFENGKFTLFDSAKFPLHNATDMFETPYGDLIFFSDGKNTNTDDEAYIALYKDGQFQKIDKSRGVNFCGSVYLYNKVTPVVDDKGNTWIPFIGSGTNAKLNIGTTGVLMYDGKDFHSYPGLQKYLVGNTRVISVLFLEKDKNIYATISDLNGVVYSKDADILFKLVNNRWEKVNLYKDIEDITNLTTKENISDFKYTYAKLIPGNEIFPDLLSIGVLEETAVSIYNEQYFYFDNGWKKYDGFKGFPITTIKDAAFIQNPLGFSLYFPNKSILLNKNDGITDIECLYPYMYSDKNGIVWIYYSNANVLSDYFIDHVGINVWDGNKLHKVTTNEGLSSNKVYNLTEDSKGRIWLPTDKGLDLARAISTNNDQWVIKIDPITKRDNKTYDVSDILETKSGEIYTWQNYVRPEQSDLHKADFFLGKIAKDKVVEISNPLPDSLKRVKYQRHRLYELPNGNLLLASSFSESISDIEGSKTKLMIFNSGKWSVPPSSWNVPKKNLRYVGTLYDKMYFLSPGSFYSFDGNMFTNLSDSVNNHADFRILKEASSAGTITNIQAGDYLYIRLRLKGLAIFDGQNLNFYTTKNGLPTANIWDPITDLKGNAYFLHNLGGLIINGEHFNSFYNDNPTLTGQTAMSQDRNGNILFWYPHLGLYINRETAGKSEIKLSYVKVNSSQYYYNKPSSFSYSENSFVFNYSTLNYKDSKSAIYKHKLEGYDLDWSKSSNLQFSEYQNVPPGNYKFQVIALNNEGSKTNQVTYAFSISPPYWKTWWAYSLYLIIFCGLLFSIRKLELNRQRKNSEIKESTLRAQAAEAQAKVIRAENERKTKELEEARQLQLSMLPKELPKLPHLDIAVYMKTATEVGGDYYDFHVSMDGTMTVVIGDATGHGMKAGTIVTTAKSLFRTHAANPDILFSFEEFSRCIKEMNFGRLSMCLTMLKIKDHTLQISTAGMPPAYIFRRSTRKIEEYEFEAMPLGIMEKFPYNIKDTTLNPGDTILLLSDGLPELKKSNGEMYGYKKIRSSFENIAEQSPEKIISYLKNEGAGWVNNADPEDDITFVVIKVK